MTERQPIPPADRDAGFRIRIDRAIEELIAAVTSSPNSLTADQRASIETLLRRP